MSTTHSSFISISTALITKLLVIEQLLYPALKSAVSAPWHNFQLCPSLQQIMATPLDISMTFSEFPEWWMLNCVTVPAFTNKWSPWKASVNQSLNQWRHAVQRPVSVSVNSSSSDWHGVLRHRYRSQRWCGLLRPGLLVARHVLGGHVISLRRVV